MPIELVSKGETPNEAPDVLDEEARPYFKLGNGTATIYLSTPIAGVDVYTMRRLKAKEFAEARSASRGDEDQFYFRAIASSAGIGAPLIGDADTADYICMRKVIDIFCGF